MPESHMIDRTRNIDSRHQYSPSTSNGPQPDAFSPLEVFSVTAAVTTLIRYRKRLILLPLLLSVLVISIGLLGPLSYTAGGSFVPQEVDASALSSLAGLASQFGVAVPQTNAAQSPAFYADLLTSRPILEALVDSQYRVRVDTGLAQGDLVFFLGTHASTADMRRELAIRAMRDHLLADFDPRTGVIEFSVKTKRRELSYQVAQRVLALVNAFNLRIRQEEGEAQRSFTESRLDAARNELQVAEDALEAFLKRNRSYAGDPELTVEHDRLSRDLEIKQQLYLSLAQSFEKSRLDAVRNTPAITVVSEPRIPVIPDRRYLLLKGTAAFVFAFLAIAGFVLGRQAIRSNQQSAPELDDLLQAFGEARSEIASGFRNLRWRSRRAASL
jgi:uncharacterized protein involved in exopolysaccharide biosynthesis